MRRSLTFALVVLGLVAIAGCGSTTTTTGSNSSGTTVPPTSNRTGTSTTPAGLSGTSWQLVSYQGTPNVTVPAAPAATATLAFGAGGALTGSTGCNQFGGTYTADATNLTITLGPMTLMGCTSPVLTAQQTALTQLLPKVTGYAATAEQLTLTGADKAVLLTYEPGLAGLEGTAWKVTGVNNGNAAVVGTAATEALTLSFGTGGALTGFTGCNDLTGNYTTTAPDQLTLSGGRSTQKTCSSDAATLETQYLDALHAATTYTIAGDQLTLRNSDGATQVTLRLSS